ncbi:hypothetical protein [Sediminibacterium sp.]|uniref:hypothetical protein n=1 Tax=Sediminibacterium sp. TaxID=1917865 RepID=UPI00273258E9|nr:hypothetical protein [Sediminibacterium sp.]MDP3394954.1 hypothetical protein [Sediminibacterium sp.]MDP3565580.1 hypothetical protein [Sediminibacterium sp.]
MYRFCIPLILVASFFLPVQAQQKSQRTEDIKKIQSFQKGIKPNGKNDEVLHPTKSDGTMDMRYKANKEKLNAIAPGPRKADGTPDMRYKENKQLVKPTAKKTASTKKKQ